MDLAVFAEFLPERGHTPLQMLTLTCILRVHVRLRCMVSTSSLNRKYNIMGMIVHKQLLYRLATALWWNL